MQTAFAGLPQKRKAASSTAAAAARIGDNEDAESDVPLTRNRRGGFNYVPCVLWAVVMLLFVAFAWLVVITTIGGINLGKVNRKLHIDLDGMIADAVNNAAASGNNGNANIPQQQLPNDEREMRLVSVINGTLPGALPLDATTQNGRVRFVENSAGESFVFFPRNSAYVNGVCCGRWQNTYPSGCAVPPPSGLDEWSLADPTNPARLPSLLVGVGTTTTHVTRPVSINTPHFKGTVLAMSVERCSATSAAQEGVYIVDVTQPSAPSIRYGPFTVTASSTGTGSDCQPNNRHHIGQLFSYSAGGRAFFTAIDFCRYYELGLPDPFVQFEITNPDAPVLLNYFGTTPLAPPLPPTMLINELDPPPIYYQTIYNEDAVPFYLDNDPSKPCIYNGAGTAGFEVACLKNFSAAHSIPYFEHTVVSKLSTPDYIKPERPLFKQAYSGGVSPDGSWSVAAHFDPGEVQPYFTFADTDPERLEPHQMCGICRIKEGFCPVDTATDNLLSGQTVCGLPVFVGPACPADTTYPTPLASSLDTSLLQPGDVFIAVVANGECYFYGTNYAVTTQAGYNITILAPDNSEASWGGFPPYGCYTATIDENTPEVYELDRRGVVFASSWFAFQTLFGLPLDGTQFPGTFGDNVAHYPPVGTVGPRICVNDWTSYGLQGYWHMLNTTNQRHLGQWAPPEAQIVAPWSLLADANPAGGSVPSFDRRFAGSNLVLVESGYTGMHLLRGRGIENDNPYYTPTVKYGLVEEAYTPRADVTSQSGDIGAFWQPHLFYSAFNKGNITYAFGLQRDTALGFIYHVPESVMNPQFTLTKATSMTASSTQTKSPHNNSKQTVVTHQGSVGNSDARSGSSRRYKNAHESAQHRNAPVAA